MKKFIVTFLAIFYLGFASGATVYFHYCMGQLVDSTLISNELKKCSNCGMENSKTQDCCKTESKQVKVENSQKLGDNSFHFKAFSSNLAWIKHSAISQVYDLSVTVDYPFSNSPPNTDSTPIFICNCTFLI